MAAGQASAANANASLIVGSHGSGVDPLIGDVAEVLLFSADLASNSGPGEILSEYLFARYNYDVSDSIVVHGPYGLVVPPNGGTGIVPPLEVSASIPATAPPFYADPFGEQESSPRIQHAIDQAATNLLDGVGARGVYLPAGSYLCTGALVVPRDVDLYGDAQDEAVLDCRSFIATATNANSAVIWGNPSVTGSTEQGVVRRIFILAGDGSRSELNL